VTTFVPDVAGAYVAQLIVNDGIVDSDPSTVQVQVVPAPTNAIEATKDVQVLVASFDAGVLKNTAMQNALINKLNAVIASLNAGNQADAVDQLQNDLMNKTDGCATAGAPDKNDWIKTCDEQAEMYSRIVDLIRLVRGAR
jgi:hypothetical protein